MTVRTPIWTGKSLTWIILFETLSLIPLPIFVTGATIDRFQDGNAEAMTDLPGVNYTTVVNLSIPTDCIVLNATVNVTSIGVNGKYPMAPEVSLDNNTLWSFNGTGYGALGKQELFSDGTVQMNAIFEPGGGKNSTSIRLPVGALAQNASVGLNGSGPLTGFAQIFDATGEAARDMYGSSVSYAGDVNGDGYVDLIVGAMQNCAGAYYGGRGYLYFGGPLMDNTPDLIFTGTTEYGYLGHSVSSAGDFNKDGYGDIIIGAIGQGSDDQGQAYIYFGGPSMDNIPDVILTGEWHGTGFGEAVACAGDVNGDGCDDIIVGAPWNSDGGRDAGRAYIYYGGLTMDDKPDVILTGEAMDIELGTGVSGAGDVNKDGYDDVIVGARCSNVVGPGRAYVFFGGPSMDNTPDVYLQGELIGDWFGWRVSAAGDVNNDGYDDIMVFALRGDGSRVYLYLGGAAMDSNPDTVLAANVASNAGDLNGDGYDDIIAGARYSNDNESDYRINIFFGGAQMDTNPDMTINTTSRYALGDSISGGGDLNGDGRNEIIAGAEADDSIGVDSGRTYVFSLNGGLQNASMSVGSELVWRKFGIFSGYIRTRNLSGELNRYLRSASPSGTDTWGNSYVDVPVDIAAEGEGTIGLLDLKITYRWTAAIPDFANSLNIYLFAHKSEKDLSGNLTIPLMARAKSAGRLNFSGLNINYDGPPSLVEPIPTLEMDEDTINNTLLNLRQYFQDDFDPPSLLVFSIESTTNSSIVHTGTFSGRYLSADALSGSENDNWTGVVSLQVRCRDTHGFFCVSNTFDLVIRNINDPPVIMSTPGFGATIGTDYSYQVTADDGDHDLLTFSLPERPRDMTISPIGNINWLPSVRGNYDVAIAVDDGQATAFQNYTINVSGNHPPKFTSLPPTAVMVEDELYYNLTATDEDGDLLTYFLASGPQNMSIGSISGQVQWRPSIDQVGNHTVIVNVSDGHGGLDIQTFTVTVSPRPILPTSEKPRCAIASPANNSEVSSRVIIKGTALNGSLPITIVQVRIDNGAWQTSTGRENWSYLLDTGKLAAGRHTIEARAFDGSLYSDTVSVQLVVQNREPGTTVQEPPWLLVLVVIVVLAGTGAYLVVRSKRKT